MENERNRDYFEKKYWRQEVYFFSKQLNHRESWPGSGSPPLECQKVRAETISTRGGGISSLYNPCYPAPQWVSTYCTWHVLWLPGIERSGETRGLPERQVTLGETRGLPERQVTLGETRGLPERQVTLAKTRFEAVRASHHLASKINLCKT